MNFIVLQLDDVLEEARQKDERWGKNYAPYDRTFVTEKPVLFQIRDVINNQMNN